VIFPSFRKILADLLRALAADIFMNTATTAVPDTPTEVITPESKGISMLGNINLKQFIQAEIDKLKATPQSAADLVDAAIALAEKGYALSSIATDPTATVDAKVASAVKLALQQSLAALAADPALTVEAKLARAVDIGLQSKSTDQILADTTTTLEAKLLQAFNLVAGG